MWETAALLLAAVGGYVFSLRCTVSRVAALRSAGQALFFRAVFWGYIFFQSACLWLYPSRIRASDAVSTSVWSYWADSISNGAILLSIRLIPDVLLDSVRAFEADPFTPAVLALLIGAVLSWPVNLVIRKLVPDRVLVARQVDEHGSELEKMLYLSFGEGRMLLITLESGKVYAGWVFSTPSLEVDNADPGAGASILGYKSGYRDPTTKRVVFTTDYRWIYSGDDYVDVEELVTLIPLRRVLSATWFDPDLYDAFQKHGNLESDTSSCNSVDECEK